MLPLCSYNDHGEEGEAHEDALHLDEQHGAGQSIQDGGVESWDQTCDVGSWQRNAAGLSGSNVDWKQPQH